MAPMELSKILAENRGPLKDLAKSLTGGDGAGFVAGAATLVAAMATGHPELTVLAPFAQKVVARAFGNAANGMLRRELAALEAEEAKQAFVADIASAVEGLVGQALIQIIRSQHRVKEELQEELGGLREDLSQFREEFQSELRGDIVRLDEQIVRAGATGIRVGPGARQRVFVSRQWVSGPGSIGVDLK